MKKPELATILSQALELSDPEEREAFLNQACGNDSAIRTEVESLLTAHQDANQFMRVPQDEAVGRNEHAVTLLLKPPADSALDANLTGDALLAAKREEHLQSILYYRRGLTFAVPFFMCFIIFDWLIDQFVQRGVLYQLAAVRFLTLALALGPWIRLFLKPLPSPSLFRRIDAYLNFLFSASVAALSVFFQGITSPYLMAVLLVMLMRAALLSDHWKRALLPTGLSCFAPAIVFTVAMLFSEEVALQLRDGPTLTTYVIIQAMLLTGALYALVGGHTVWALRRQLFEARSIGRYRLRRLIGSGGMGEVWEAYHTSLKRNIALKILRPSGPRSAETIKRFEREVRSTALLNHPNVVKVFDFGQTVDGLFFYAMELLEGEDLEKKVLREGPLAPHEAARIASQVARALVEAHSKQIVHRDIKPGNIIVTPLCGEKDLVKVLDFGLARMTPAIDEPTLTRVGWVGGSPAYISPEIAKGERGDSRSDIYSLGCVLYFLLCGRPPFEHDNLGALLNAHLTETVVPPSRRSEASFPRALDRIVLRCLEKEPSNRYPTAQELLTDLSEA